MDLAHAELRRFWLCGIAALSMHVGAVLALPDAGERITPCETAIVSLALVMAGADSPVQDTPIGVAGATMSPTAQEPREGTRSEAARHENRRAAKPLRPSAEPVIAQPSVVLHRSAPAGSGVEPTRELPPTPFKAMPEAAGESAGSFAASLPSLATDDPTSGGQVGAGKGVAAGNLASPGWGMAGLARSRAVLLPRARACRRFFPSSATSRRGVVHVLVEVGADGRPAATRLLSESPVAQGFGPAARACAATLEFAPALSANGVPVRDEAKLELAFEREG